MALSSLAFLSACFSIRAQDAIELAEQAMAEYVDRDLTQLKLYEVTAVTEFHSDPAYEDAAHFVTTLRTLVDVEQKLEFRSASREVNRLYRPETVIANGSLENCDWNRWKLGRRMYSRKRDVDTVLSDSETLFTGSCPYVDVFYFPFTMDSSLVQQGELISASEYIVKRISCKAAKRTGTSLSSLWRYHADTAVVCVFIDIEEDLPVLVQFSLLPKEVSSNEQLLKDREKLKCIGRTKVKWGKIGDVIYPVLCEGSYESRSNRINFVRTDISISTDSKRLQPKVKDLLRRSEAVDAKAALKDTK